MKALFLLIALAISACGTKTEKVTERIIEKPGGGEQPNLCLNEIVWDTKVKTITDKNCAGCHSSMAAYDGAVNYLQVAEKGGKNGLRRVFGAAGSIMPPQGSGFILSEDEKGILDSWVKDGFKKTCSGTGSGV